MTEALYPTSTVRVHALLADGGQSLTSSGYNSIKLWYLVRGFDVSGVGYADFDLESAATILNCSKLTIRRYLKQGEAIGLFRAVQWTHGRIKVYYASRDKVCLKFGLMSWGAVADVELTELPNLKLIATELQAIALQQSSVFLARRSLPKGQKNRVVQPIDLLLKASQNSRGANVVHVGKRCIFLGSNAVTAGVSQAGIANSMNRHHRTIKRRLSDRARMSKGLEPLFKRQVAQVASAEKTFEMRELGVNVCDRAFWCKNMAWVSGCTLYLSSHTLTSNKAVRWNYNHTRDRYLMNSGIDKGHD